MTSTSPESVCQSVCGADDSAAERKLVGPGLMAGAKKNGPGFICGCLVIWLLQREGMNASTLESCGRFLVSAAHWVICNPLYVFILLIWFFLGCLLCLLVRVLLLAINKILIPVFVALGEKYSRQILGEDPPEVKKPVHAETANDYMRHQRTMHTYETAGGNQTSWRVATSLPKKAPPCSPSSQP